MDQALLTEYDSIVLVDRSGSMNSAVAKFGTRWNEAKEITLGLAGLASKVDDDGITVISFGGNFDAKRDVQDGVTVEAVQKLFDTQSPAGSTPLADALEAAFAKKFSSSKKAVIFVVTDGEPDDKNGVASAIKKAASKLDDASQIRLLFLQVGDDQAAAKYLDDLDNHLNGAKFDIVNAIGFKDANGLTPDQLYERAITDSH
jgi:Mg-chelatase subunit ChlD